MKVIFASLLTLTLTVSGWSDTPTPSPTPELPSLLPNLLQTASEAEKVSAWADVIIQTEITKHRVTSVLVDPRSHLSPADKRMLEDALEQIKAAEKKLFDDLQTTVPQKSDGD
jgi:hypothetical protein